MIFEFKGIFNIIFVGTDTATQNVVIKGTVRDPQGHFLYLIGENDTIYNWDNIILMRKVV